MRRTLAGLALAVWLPGQGAAQPQAPARLTMQRVEGMTIHLAGQEGAHNRHAKAQISVELLAGDKLRAVDTGERSEHNLYQNFSTEDVTAWTNKWSGTWSAAGGALRLALTLVDRKCERKKTMSGQPPQKLACGAVSRRVQFSCRTEEIPVEEMTGTEAAPTWKTQPRAAWVCQTEDSADLAGTPSRWVFGKAMCLRAIGGPPGEKYEKCPP